MTKEEILKDASFRHGIKERGLVVIYPEAVINSAMDEYAKQHALDFAEFIGEWLDKNSLKNSFGLNKPTTTAQLYSLFTTNI